MMWARIRWGLKDYEMGEDTARSMAFDVCRAGARRPLDDAAVTH